MEIGRDQADCVADARGEDQGFGIVEYDVGSVEGMNEGQGCEDAQRGGDGR